MIRRLFTFSCASSLLLCIGAITLHFRSNRTRESISWGKAGGSLWLIENLDGYVSVARYRNWIEDQVWTYRSQSNDMTQGAVDVAPLEPPILLADLGPDVRSSEVRFPLLEVATVAGIPPLTFISYFIYQRRKRQQAIAKGLCHRCGYDLRATPDRCPECGKLPLKATTAKVTPPHL